MARKKVKILKTCVLGIEGRDVNIKESQLPRFEGFYELVKPKKKESVKLKKVKKTKKK